MQKGICDKPGCEKQRLARGLCSTHYWQVWRFEEHNSPRTAEERFLAKIDKSGDCWTWTGTRATTNYGVLVVNKKRILAHRFSYEHFNGPIPDCLVIRHKCDNPPCVNPAHLLVGTQADNGRDMAERGRNYWGQQTHCVNGHEFSGENVYYPSSGGRKCRKCAQARVRAFKQRKRQERIDAGEVLGPHAKLKQEQALRIREAYQTGLYRQAELAEIYGVAQTTVGRIVRGVEAYAQLPLGG